MELFLDQSPASLAVLLTAAYSKASATIVVRKAGEASPETSLSPLGKVIQKLRNRNRNIIARRFAQLPVLKYAGGALWESTSAAAEIARSSAQKATLLGLGALEEAQALSKNKPTFSS